MNYYFNIVQTRETRSLAGPFHSETERERYAEASKDVGVKIIGKCMVDVSVLPPVFKYSEVF